MKEIELATVMCDSELLEQYRSSGSREALAELVRRHIPWVHGVAARRMRRNTQLADDVAQAVFLVLAQKPPRKLYHDSALAAWLFRVTCQTSNHVIRGEIRRKRREREFAMEHHEAGESNHDNEMSREEWKELAPHLDDAVLALGKSGRQTLLLRFYQLKSHAEVARSLGISDEAARQRVSRAVARLRAILEKRGVHAPASVALTGGLIAHTTPPVSAALVQSAEAAAQGANVAIQASTFAKGVILMLAWNKAKLAIGACIAALLLGGGTVVVIQGTHQQAPSAQPLEAAAAKALAGPEWRSRFDQVYRLEPGEAVKLVRRPFIPERALYFHEARPRTDGYVDGPDVAVFRWNGSLLANPVNGFGFRDEDATIDKAIYLILGAQEYEVEIPKDALAYQLNGDWIARNNATPEEVLEGLCKVVRDGGGPSLRFTQENRVRQVVLVTGIYSYQQLEGTTPNAVAIYVDQLDPIADSRVITAMDFDLFLSQFSKPLGLRVVNQATGPKRREFRFARHASASKIPAEPGPQRDEQIHKLFEAASKQTGLQFSVETVTDRVWVAHPADK